MRTVVHYVKIAVFGAAAICVYLAVVGLAIFKSDSVGLPVTASLVSAGVATVTAILVLVKDPIMEAINRPRLTVRFFPCDKRECHATAFTDTKTGALVAKTHYFRFRVENVGWRTAEDVEVTLEKVERFENGRFLLDSDFMPLRLFWSHWREKRFEVSIPPGTYRHCDFGFVIDPAAASPPLRARENGSLLYWLDVFPRPNTGRTSLLPGHYRISVSAFGKNVQGAFRTVELKWKGIWHDDIRDMLRDSFLPLEGFDPA